MTNTELLAKINTEIKRLKSNMDDIDPLAPNQKAGYLFALADILSFLSTLESEKPMEELEDEMDRYFETMPVFEHENIFEETFQNIARHFAQWGAEHLKK